MQSKMRTLGPHKPPRITQEVITISDSSDDEITIEPGGEDDDDVDEDVLLLRLQALKSMAEALSDEENTPANDFSTFLSPASPLEDSLTNEMVNLLDEADSAAQHVPNSENLCDVNTAPREKALGTSSTPDSLSTPNLLEIRKKVKAKKISNFPPRTSKEQKSDLGQEEEVMARSSQSDEIHPARGMLRVSSFARMSANDEMTAVRSTYPDNYDIIDMEVVNSAEDQFFRDQMDPEKQRESHFYWGMISNLPPPPPPPPVVQMSDVLLLPTSEEQYEAFLTACASGGPRHKERSRSKVSGRKRRSSDSEARLVGSHATKGQNLKGHIKDTFQSAKKSKDAESNAKLIQKTIDNDDYIKELRTKLLSSVKKPEEKSQMSRQETEVSPSMQTKPDPSSSKSKQLLSSTKSPKRPNSALGNLNKKTLRMKKAISSLRDEETRKKHFPNLFSTYIISLSDSEEEDDLVDHSNNQKKTDPLVLSNDFEAHLNSFLKSIRTSEENKAVPPPKPARKNPPGKLTNLKTMISSVQKVKPNNPVDQANSLLMLMPPEKQEEYKRLKALIEKNEKAKKLGLHSKAIAAAKMPAKPTISQEKLRDEDEDENDLEAQLLREKLLSSLMKKKKKPDDNVESKQKQSLTVSISHSQKTRKVSFGSKQRESNNPSNNEIQSEILPQTGGKSPEVQSTKSPDPEFQTINEENRPQLPKCSSSVPSSGSCAIKSPQRTMDVQALKDSEKMLFLSRIAMIQRLGKLSEGTQLLVDERNKVQETEKFAEDLRKQLTQVENILESQKQRVNQLQISTKETHKDLIPLRHRMQEAESLCLSNGLVVHGSSYTVPLRGTERIEELWSQVRQNVGTLMFQQKEEGTPPNGEKVDEQTISLEEANPTSQESVPDVNDANQVGFHSLNNSNYEGSALEHLKPQNGLKLNPFQDLCPYWLMGRCNNETCQYQHS